MSKKLFISYLVSCVITIIFTGYCIIQLSNSGGPCNAGIAFIIPMPVLIICSFLLATAFYSMYNQVRPYYRGPKISSAISLVIWTYCSYEFLKDGTTDYGFFYLGVFEALNIWTVMIAIPTPA
jgi:hypothetical protein